MLYNTRRTMNFELKSVNQFFSILDCYANTPGSLRNQSKSLRSITICNEEVITGKMAF